MASDEALPTIKIIIIGPSGSGKSALLIRYCDDLFDSQSSTATIGVDFKLKKLSVRGTAYRLNLLDTAGQERFRTLSNSYYRGAHGVMLVYDISNRDSFTSMELWFNEAETHAVQGVVTFLIGSKVDKSSSRAVSFAEGEELAKRHGSTFLEVSAKTRENVRRSFLELVDQIVSSSQLVDSFSGQPRGALELQKGASSGGSSCSC